VTSHAGPKQLERLLDAVTSIASDLDPAMVLKRIVEAGRGLVGARYAALGVLDPTGTHLSGFITVGLDDEERAGIGERPKGRGILGPGGAVTPAISAARSDPGRVNSLEASPEGALPPAYQAIASGPCLRCARTDTTLIRRVSGPRPGVPIPSVLLGKSVATRLEATRALGHVVAGTFSSCFGNSWSSGVRR
jgi:hypothetical protein